MADIAADAIRHGAIQDWWELTSCLEIVVASDPYIIVEIGCDAGGTLYAWAQVAPMVVGIDLPNAACSTGRELNAHGATIIIGDSHAEDTRARLVTALEGHAIDVLFIDGDHSYDAVSRDFTLYSPLVRENGLVIFHDIAVENDPRVEVPRFWQEIKAQYPARELYLSGSWAGIGIIWMR